MEKRAAVAQERFAFAGSELQLKAHKVRVRSRSGEVLPSKSEICAMSVGTFRVHSRTKSGLDRGICVVAAASDPIKSS